MKEYTNNNSIPLLEDLIKKTDIFKDIPMLSFTHGQPATPTTLKRQFNVFITRLKNQLIMLKNYKWRTKLGGATGDLNAHKISFPDIDWYQSMEIFLKEEFDLIRLNDTTQISHYDDYSELFSIYIRINTILLDMVKDIWTYISMEYIIQIPNGKEVGSSAMPHKINPIDFENAEGNLQISNALLQFFITKLPVSRLQRDLTDSTVLRNLGAAFGHSYISILSIIKGFGKIKANEEKITVDLMSHPEILTEAYQTILKTIIPPLDEDPYITFKNFSRGKKITINILHHFLDFYRGKISDEMMKKLKEITPKNYL